MKQSKNPDAQAYRDAAALIADKKADFCCNVLKHSPNRYFPGIGRPDLVLPFREVFLPAKEKYVDEFFAFWNEDAKDGHITKTNSAEHSRECRIFALLFMAEMIENP